jgi:hypothetical protein
MTSIVRALVWTLVICCACGGLAARVALADPPPWAGKWKHDHDDDDDDYDDFDHHHHKHDHDDGRCREIVERIHNDRAKIREIEPTGRHRKALQWYRDDLGNARNDLAACRHGG